MKSETFSKGIAILSMCFPNLDLNPERIQLMHELLNDLSDEVFIQSIRNMAQNLKEIYPNTNLIAHIREKSDEIKKVLPFPRTALELTMSKEEQERNRLVAKKYIRELNEKLGMKK